MTGRKIPYPRTLPLCMDDWWKEGLDIFVYFENFLQTAVNETRAVGRQ